MENYLFLAIGLALGVALGWLVGRLRVNQSSAPSDLALQNARLEAENKAGLELIGELRADLARREAAKEQESRIMEALAPVKSQVEVMQETMQRFEREQGEKLGGVQKQIESSLQSEKELRDQTQALAKVLSSSNLRGVWGETQLRRLVELAGLIKHLDFDEQATTVGSDSTGRADMIINLPEGKRLVIDSKAPMTAYLEASSISDLASPAEKARRDTLLQEHVKAMRGHIDTLAKKSYWSHLDTSPDFVLAFIPSESLLSAALELDPGLLDYAFQKNVPLASPVSVFSVLKTIAHIWRQNADEAQLREMLKVGRELYDRVALLLEKTEKLGNSIGSVVANYNAFVSSLESRMLVSARKLNDLDESAIGGTELPKPKQLEEAPKSITAPERDGA